MDILGNLYATLAALAGIAGVVFAFWRKVRPWSRRVGNDIRAGRDALVGREEIRDSITGRVISPALPGMGVRMDNTERQLTTLSEAFKTLADTHVQILEHDRRIKVLEDAQVERIVTKAESTQAWRAMEAVARATPPEDDSPLPGLGEN